MEEKKSSKANLEKERGTFFLMGLIVVLSIFYVLLNWNFLVNSSNFDYMTDTEVFIENELDHLSLDIQMEIPEPIMESSNELPVIYEDYNEVNEKGEAEKKDDIKELLSLESIIIDNIHSIVDKHKQKELEKELKEDVFETADILPTFPGGQNALTRFIYKSIRYPEAARKQNIQGRVVGSFVIEKDGTVSEVKLEKGVYSYLDDEALRVLKTMPAWKPGLKDGEPIRVKYILPVYFRL